MTQATTIENTRREAIMVSEMRIAGGVRAVRLPLCWGPYYGGRGEGWGISLDVHVPEEWWWEEGYYALEDNNLVVSQAVADELLELAGVGAGSHPDVEHVRVWAPELPGWENRPIPQGDDDEYWDIVEEYHDGHVLVMGEAD